MFTKKQVIEFIAAARKAVGKAQASIQAAQHNADPAVNAELQHSLQKALEQMGTAMKRLNEANTQLSAISAAVQLMIPADKEPEKDEVPGAVRSA